MHWNVLRTLHNPKKQPPRNIRIAVPKHFRKFPRVLFNFLLLNTLHHEWLQGILLNFSEELFQGTHSDGCFSDYLRKPSWRFSVPQMQLPGNVKLFRKNSRKLPGKKLCWCAIFNFNLKKHFIMHSFLVIFSNTSEQLFQTTSSAGCSLEVFCSTEAIAGKC